MIFIDFPGKVNEVSGDNASHIAILHFQVTNFSFEHLGFIHCVLSSKSFQIFAYISS